MRCGLQERFLSDLQVLPAQHAQHGLQMRRVRLPGGSTSQHASLREVSWSSGTRSGPRHLPLTPLPWPPRPYRSHHALPPATQHPTLAPLSPMPHVCI